MTTKDRIALARAKSPEAHAWVQAGYLLGNTRRRARLTGRPHTLTRQWIYQMLLLTKYCPVLGIELRHSGTGQPNDHSPSLDCFEQSFGYVPENVTIISYRANTIKGNATPAELYSMAMWTKGREDYFNSAFANQP